MEKKKMEELHSLLLELINRDVEKEAAITISLMLKTEDKYAQLTEWINSNPEATQDDITEEALRIRPR